MIRTLLQLNVLVGLSAASICAAASLVAGTTPSWTGPAIAFALALAVYNFDRIADTSPAEGRSTPDRAATIRRTRGVLIWVIPALLLGALTAAAVNGFEPLLWSLAFPALGAAYVLPVLPTRTGRPKDVPYLKCFYTAGCWSIFVGLGMGCSGLAFFPTALPFALFLFVRSFVSTYLGDIRDLEDDAEAGLETIASRIGRRRSFVLLDACHALSAALLLGLVAWGVVPCFALAMLLPAAIGFLIYRTYRRFPHHHELLFELYDVEAAAYAPCLFAAAALS